MTNEVELIKQKLNLAEFIRDYVTLHPAGRNFKALCPFHQEKTPSFIVSPEKQLWRCFGSCGEGGDIIKFLMRYENIDFVEALKILAEKAGIELQNSHSPQQREVNVLYDLHEKARDFFRESLSRRSDVSDYLVKDRGLLPATIEEFSLGFAPGGDYLMTHLVKAGYDINDIVKAGLASKNTRGLYRDRFDNRVIFPIFNHFGRPVAFTGRILPAVAESFHGDFIPPKYLNSPESLIFNKSKILYGFHKSKNEIARSQQIFLVEGQMDFLMSWQAGIKTAAAVSGSALSEHHLQAIRRLADTIFLNFDKDDAGVKALERSLELLGGFDFNIKVVDLGNFKDPAEAVKADSGFLSRAF
ncbi:MAG: DNA primase, partial [bacterium]|nr:DNA primase [bacterium]